jgi:hypothetical protein
MTKNLSRALAEIAYDKPCLRRLYRTLFQI